MISKSAENNTGQSKLRPTLSVAVGFFSILILPIVAFTLVSFNFPRSYRIPANQPPPVWITQLYTTIMIVSSFIGGYITARFSKQSQTTPVFILAIIWFALGLSSLRSPSNPIIFEAVRMAINSGILLLGGYYLINKNRGI